MCPIDSQQCLEADEILVLGKTGYRSTAWVPVQGTQQVDTSSYNNLSLQVTHDKRGRYKQYTKNVRPSSPYLKQSIIAFRARPCSEKQDLHALSTCMHCPPACTVHLHALSTCMHCPPACTVHLHEHFYQEQNSSLIRCMREIE